MSERRPGSPLTRQRSPWVQIPGGDATGMLSAAGCADVALWARRVHDGELAALVSRNPPEFRWHLSVSHRPHRAHGVQRAAKRYPTWDELAHARYELLPEEIDIVMKLPPASEFIAVHDTTFHLHEVEQ